MTKKWKQNKMKLKTKQNNKVTYRFI